LNTLPDLDQFAQTKFTAQNEAGFSEDVCAFRADCDVSRDSPGVNAIPCVIESMKKLNPKRVRHVVVPEHVR
jgi:hypothetical protein